MSSSTDLASRWAPTLFATAPDPAEVAEQADANHTGVMIALYPAPVVAAALAVPGGEPVDELHLTLAFLGDSTELLPEALPVLQGTIARFAAWHAGLTGQIAGWGVFTGGPTPVTYASPDVPGLPEFRQALVEELRYSGVPAKANHGYTPHITLTYSELPDPQVPMLPLAFNEIVLVWAGRRYSYPLLTQLVLPAVDELVEAAPVQSASIPRPRLQLMERAPVAEPAAPAGETARAFVTEISGKTIITAPATTITSWEKALTPNPHFLWMAGRFVGAERANRNGAYWSSGDLELGQATVTHGPLNWLHESRHIIGTIADSTFLPGRDASTPVEAAAETVDPHIVAASAIWKWIYPDEAWVIQQANDAQRLWYSMECISENVLCREEACNSKVSYGQYLNELGCAHMTQRAGIRHFENPTFLGGAVIVPPARPGWADADAGILATASAQAEKAYEQAGRPDVKASEWDMLMASVVAFAQGVAL